MSGLSAFLQSDAYDGTLTRQWKKTTFASRIRCDTTCSASKSPGTIQAMSFLKCVYDLPDPNFPAYNLTTLLDNSRADSSHSEACGAIQEWLKGTSDRDIKVGTGLGSPVADDSYYLSQRKLADVIFYNDQSEAITLIEVMSCGSRESTICKLGLGLMDQLVSQRNRNDEIKFVKGFYFPWHLDEMYVEEVKCHWHDEKNIFKITSTRLQHNMVRDHILHNVDAEKEKVRGLRNCHNNHYTIPLTDRYIKTLIGADAVQVRSGNSFVIQTDSHIFKCPFGMQEYERLNLLSSESRSLNHSILPTCIKILQNKAYFQFERCSEPLTVHQGKENIVDLTSAVVDAIDELHMHGIAHLDIRLENICFKNYQAVLIDFDRSLPTNESTELLSFSLGPSVMYSSPPDADWTVDKLDWKQLAIMVLSILNETPPKDYHKVPTQYRDPFFRKMYMEG